MDTCIRAGYYEQALELSNYAARLERRLGRNSLIQSIANDVKNQRQLLLENLLDQLTTSINLSTCLKVVSYLKRLDVYTETELLIKFLTVLRGEWLDNLLASVPNANSYDHVTKIMELLRNHMFDVISQYRAAFPVEDFSSRAHFKKQESQSADTSLFIPHHSSIFPCWLSSRIDRLAAILDEDLKLLFSPENVDENTDFSRLEAILNQFMHLGLSLSRIGCDIRYPIAPVFVNFIKKSIEDSINSSTDKFLTRIISEFDSTHFAKSSFIKPSTDQAFIPDKCETSAPNTGDDAEKSASIDPPLSLMQSRSLALYCNAILTVFNNFRSCLPLNLSYDVTEILNSNLNIAYSSINDYKKNIDNENREQNVENFCALFLLDFVPFLNYCLKSLFPVKQLAAYLGNEMVELEKLQIALNLNVIVQH
uniref:Conserved oligomeric Golgi complex subunit 8 n=1 Tax=Romanomermis culicivorax TaxID=13658 RepID=A0A915JGD4_ROMCU